MRKVLVGVAVMVALLAAGYASLPWLVNVLVLPRLIDQGGLDALELEIGYPGFKRLNIARLHLEAASLTLDARDVELSYSIRGLRSNRMDNIEVGELALVVLIPQDSTSASTESTENSDQPATSPTQALGAMLERVPADRVIVKRLQVAVPSLDFLSHGELTLEEEKQ